MAFGQDQHAVRADRGDRSDDPAASATRHFPINADGANRQVLMVDEIDALATQGIPERPIAPDAFRQIAPDAVNLTYHGGDVINTAKVVCIFWGPTWASGGSDSGNASAIQSFRNQLGTSSHHSMLTQYYDANFINTTNLAGSQADWFDTT